MAPEHQCLPSSCGIIDSTIVGANQPDSSISHALAVGALFLEERAARRCYEGINLSEEASSLKRVVEDIRDPGIMIRVRENTEPGKLSLQNAAETANNLSKDSSVLSELCTRRECVINQFLSVVDAFSSVAAVSKSLRLSSDSNLDEWSCVSSNLKLIRGDGAHPGELYQRFDKSSAELFNTIQGLEEFCGGTRFDIPALFSHIASGISLIQQSRERMKAEFLFPAKGEHPLEVIGATIESYARSQQEITNLSDGVYYVSDSHSDGLALDYLASSIENVQVYRQSFAQEALGNVFSEQILPFDAGSLPTIVAEADDQIQELPVPELTKNDRASNVVTLDGEDLVPTGTQSSFFDEARSPRLDNVPPSAESIVTLTQQEVVREAEVNESPDEGYQANDGGDSVEATLTSSDPLGIGDSAQSEQVGGLVDQDTGLVSERAGWKENDVTTTPTAEPAENPTTDYQAQDLGNDLAFNLSKVPKASLELEDSRDSAAIVNDTDELGLGGSSDIPAVKTSQEDQMQSEPGTADDAFAKPTDLSIDGQSTNDVDSTCEGSELSLDTPGTAQLAPIALSENFLPRVTDEVQGNDAILGAPRSVVAKILTTDVEDLAAQYEELLPAYNAAVDRYLNSERKQAIASLGWMRKRRGVESPEEALTKIGDQLEQLRNQYCKKYTGYDFHYPYFDSLPRLVQDCALPSFRGVYSYSVLTDLDFTQSFSNLVDYFSADLKNAMRRLEKPYAVSSDLLSVRIATSRDVLTIQKTRPGRSVVKIGNASYGEFSHFQSKDFALKILNRKPTVAVESLSAAKADVLAIGIGRYPRSWSNADLKRISLICRDFYPANFDGTKRPNFELES